MKSRSKTMDDTRRSESGQIDVGTGYDNLDEIIKAESNQKQTGVPPPPPQPQPKGPSADSLLSKDSKEVNKVASIDKSPGPPGSPASGGSPTSGTTASYTDESEVIAPPVTMDIHHVPFLCCNVKFKSALDMAGIITLLIAFLPLLAALIYLKYYQYNELARTTTPQYVYMTHAPKHSTTVVSETPHTASTKESSPVPEDTFTTYHFFYMSVIWSEAPVAICALFIGIFLLLSSAFVKKRILVSCTLLITIIGFIFCIFSLVVTIGYLIVLGDHVQRYFVAPAIILIYATFNLIWFIFCILLEINVLRVTKRQGVCALPAESLATTTCA